MTDDATAAPLTIQGQGSSPSAVPLSPADLDAVTRTVATEAGNPDAWGAVANSIRNRALQGGYGDTPAGIVTKKGQYEVWANGRAQNLDPSDPAYQQAQRVVAAVFSGQAPDNTDGATHFYSPSGQQALGADGRQQVPDWAPPGSATASVGGNVFFAPKGRVTAQAASQSAPQPTAPIAQPASAQSAAAAPASAFDALEVEHPADAAPASAAASAPASAAPAASASPFDALAVEHPGDAAAAAAPAGATTGSDKGGVVAGAASLLNGLPIVGPAVLDLANKAGAETDSLFKGQSYDDALAARRANVGASQAAHPIASGAGQVGGAIVGFAPLAAAAPEALGLTGGNMLTRMAAGAASNALIGGADSAARGESPATGALYGGAAGAIAPPVAKLVGNALGATLGGSTGLIQSGLNRLGSSGSSSGIEGISMPAAKYALKGLTSDGLDSARNALTGLGDQGMLLDTGPGARGISAGMLSPGSPEASITTNALTGRDAGSDARVMNALQTNIGPEIDPVKVASGIEEARTKATSPVYGKVFANAPPVDVSGVVADIDGQLKTAVGAQAKGLQFLRNNLVVSDGGVDATGATIPPTYEDNAEKLFNLRQEIDKAVGGKQPGLGLQPSAVTRADHSMMSVRGALDGALKGQVPGLAEVDGAFSHSADVQNAVENGYKNVLGANGAHPDSFAQARAGMDPDVAQAENAGIAGKIYRNFGSGTQRDVVKLDRTLAGGDDGYATRNLGTAFGQDAADNLLNTVRQEKTFAGSSAELIGKSNTNRLGAAQKLAQETEPGSANLSGLTSMGALAQGGKKLVADPLVRIIMANPNASRNIEVARMMTAQGADAQQVLDKLTKLDGQFRGASAVKSAIGGGTNALLGYSAPALADTADGWEQPNPLVIRGSRR